MMRKLRPWIPGMTLAVLLALTVGQTLVVGPEARAAGGGTLEGTWLMEATLVNCATGAQLPIPGNPFPALHTYMYAKRHDAGHRRFPPPPPPSEAVTRSTAHGIWEHTGG